MAGVSIIEGGIPDSKTHFSKNAHIRKRRKSSLKKMRILHLFVLLVCTQGATLRKKRMASHQVVENLRIDFEIGGNFEILKPDSATHSRRDLIRIR